MRFQNLFWLALVPAFLASCAGKSTPSTDKQGHTPQALHVESGAADYHLTGNCAMEFTAADSARREAKYAEPGVEMVELSSGNQDA